MDVRDEFNAEQWVGHVCTEEIDNIAAHDLY